MTPHLPPALRRAQSTYMLSTEPLRPTHPRSRSVVRLLGGWPEKKTALSTQEFVDDLKLQRYRMSEFPDSLRGSATSSSSSNRSGKHRSLSPGRNYDSGDDASDEASSSSAGDPMSIAELGVAPAATRAQDLGDEMMADVAHANPAAAEAEPPAVMAPPSAPKKPKYAPRFLPYTKTPPRGYKVLQKTNAVDGGADHRWSPPGDGFTRKEARPLGVCIGSSKRKLSDLAAAVGFLDLTPQSDARDLGWTAAAPCDAAAEMETPRKRRLAPGFAAARDMDLDESLRRGRPRMRRVAAKPRSPARAPSVRAPKEAAAAQPQPETALDAGGCDGSGLSAAAVHCSHPLSLRPGLPRPFPQNVVPATPRDAFVLASLTP